ncbi:leucine aminopeptidase [Naegleria gruberi]|uniref:Leucine aminopeptidase n=1 Tax=Naegleria gruberi TaxID=5762 RepID=D2V1Z3_NAEGR|nr:leucine aminopeptidase [Naegleria gruberi]EFC49245.1 leucine aminopeptidase [Naegleria gruberi]|eukprot:XP_002681989.1 leucine aminopeptidase [Naegleria gruberi strain NEG-M]
MSKQLVRNVLLQTSKRSFHTSAQLKKDYILGVYKDGSFSPSAYNLLSEQFLSSPFFTKKDWKEGKISLIDCGMFFDGNKCSIAKNEITTDDRIVFVGLGEKDVSTKKISYKKKLFKEQFGQHEIVDINQPSVRDLAQKAVQALLSDVKKPKEEKSEKSEEEENDSTLEVFIDDLTNGQEAVEGLKLGSWKFIKLSKKTASKTLNQLSEGKVNVSSNIEKEVIDRAIIYSDAQNFSAYLSELPANYLTPKLFCKTVTEKFQTELGDLLSKENSPLTIKEHDKKWCEEMKMGSFLGVSQGSAEEPRVLEITFMNNPKDNTNFDIIYVGKGITFDSGGISIKPAAGMKDMKGDMSGAGSVMATMLAVCKLNLPVNIKCIAMLCENMPSSTAYKPGDVITARNGKTIEVDNTDAEGRLALADGLCYASEFKPNHLIDVATLTGACVVALGTKLTGCYTSTNDMWKRFEKSGINTKDYMWRMPFMPTEYEKQNESNVAHVKNSGGRNAGSITACCFLSEFVDFEKVPNYAHLDIAGTNSDAKGIHNGRPTRALIEYVRLLQEE